MFLSLRSPFGGNALSSEWLKQARVKKEGINLEPDGKPTIIDQFWAYKVGYCDDCGKPLHVSTKTAEFLFKQFYKMFK